MDEMNRKRVEVLRKQYPPGCTVVLVSMDDEFAPPKGTKGKVIHVDTSAASTLHGKPARLWEWYRGSTR